MSDHIEHQALKLSRKERTDLVVKLLRSLESDPDAPDTMDEWVEEAEARYQAWKQGKVKTFSEQEAQDHIEKRLKK